MWTEVIIHKYILPTPLLDWIKDMGNTNLPNGSIIWKSLCKSFPLILEGLVWKVGDGSKVRIGVDPWPSCSQNHILPQQLIQLIHHKGYFHLNQIVDPLSTNIWHQGWKKSQDLELPDQWSRQWDQYTLALQTSHIRITNRADELIWEKAQHGKYTPKLEYQQLCLQHFQENQKWWQKGIWKLKCPLKEKIFTWCTLANKIPTWYHLQKR